MSSKLHLIAIAKAALKIFLLALDLLVCFLNYVGAGDMPTYNCERHEPL